MVKLLINGDKAILKQQAVLRTVFDPACGTGGMLSIAKEYIQAEINPQADIRLFGQEVNDETYAICKSDMYLKRDDRDADNIKPDSSFSHDGHSGSTFDYMLCNPPYGKDWNKEKKFIEEEAARGAAGRFEAGLPRSSDWQLLFLLHMLSKMKPPAEGGSRVAIIMNGSPLFTGDAGKGALPVLSIPSSMQKNDCEESIPLLPWLEALLLETSERERFGWCFNPVSLQLKLNRPVRHQRPTAEWVSRISAASARSPVSSSDRRRARVILTLHHRMTFADRAANGWRWPVFPSERLLRCYAMPT
jgi:hypothetical protein